MTRTLNDERTEGINGKVSFWVLMLTQFALAGVIVYKRYILGLPMEDYAELSWIVILSMAGYWGLRVFFSGNLPVLSVKQMLVIYAIAVAVIIIPTWAIHGLPGAGRWYEVLYPFLGVAVVMFCYGLVARFGKRRLEKNLSEE